jgi:hypothetical protein
MELSLKAGCGRIISALRLICFVRFMTSAPKIDGRTTVQYFGTWRVFTPAVRDGVAHDIADDDLGGISEWTSVF